MSEEEHQETELEQELDNLYRKAAVLDNPDDYRSPKELEIEAETLSGPNFQEPSEVQPEQARKRWKLSLSKLRRVFAFQGTTILSIVRSLTPRRALAAKFLISRRAAALVFAPLFLGMIVFFGWPWIYPDKTIDRGGGVHRQGINRTAAEAMRDAGKEPLQAPVVTGLITPNPEEVKVPAATALPAEEKEDNKKKPLVFDLPLAGQRGQHAIPLHPPAVTGMTTPKAEEVQGPASAALPAEEKAGNKNKPPVVNESPASQRGKYAIQIRAYPENQKHDAIMFLEDVRKREPVVAMETVQIAGRGVWHRILLGNFSTAHEAADYRKKHQLARQHPESFIQRRSGSSP